MLSVNIHTIMLLFDYYLYQLLFINCYIHMSYETCEPEITHQGYVVTWPETPDDEYAISNPPCFTHSFEIVTRYCLDGKFQPLSINKSCNQIIYDIHKYDECPIGYIKVSENFTNYCFYVGERSVWDNPCFYYGSSAVITDLDNEELDHLFVKLQEFDSDYFWLPGRRRKSFNPIVWNIPGRLWNTFVLSSEFLRFQESIFQNCLVLDVRNRLLSTATCNNMFRPLCLFTTADAIKSSGICPKNYYTFNYLSNQKYCYGIEKSNNSWGQNWSSFLESECKKPMVIDSDLKKYIFSILANQADLKRNEFCWYNASANNINNEQKIFKGTINTSGHIGKLNERSRLSCMACEKEPIKLETDIIFDCNDYNDNLRLTIYNPSGLFKDESNYKGVQCFSDANGFFETVAIEKYIDTMDALKTICTNCDKTGLESLLVPQIIYEISPIKDRSAQYWCEAHSINFTFIQTRKILVEPQGKSEHVFSLVIAVNNTFTNVHSFPDINEILENVSSVFDAKNVYLMDILDINMSEIVLLLHILVSIEKTDSNTFQEIFNATYTDLIDIANNKFSDLNIRYINMSSATHCPPAFSYNRITLEWEMTRIGDITAPIEFCLQRNGLPVKRNCLGDYYLGGHWSEVEGNCSYNYQASNTTTYLYSVAKSNKHTSENLEDFITEGIIRSLEDLDIIIPADIYYLSVSLNNAEKYIAENNYTVQLPNLTWAMNRIISLNRNYLQLSQTMNSTNVILDSMDEIINSISTKSSELDDYQMYIESHYLLQISNYDRSGISGLALKRNRENDTFNDMEIIPLKSSSNLNDLLKYENLEVAAWIPESVINEIKFTSNNTLENMRIVISVFSDDAVFQQIGPSFYSIENTIIGITIPNHQHNFMQPIIVMIKSNNTYPAERSCGYWDFNSGSKILPGHWSMQGCYVHAIINSTTICYCYHLTYFGQLVYYNTDNGSKLYASHAKVLNFITVIGCILSLIGVLGIWLTAIVFQNWRRKPGTKVLLELSISIALPLTLMLMLSYDLNLFEFNNDHYMIADDKRNVCIVIGASLHYSILSGFTWMLITAILQFHRFVRVLGVQRPPRYILKFSVIGWGAPILPVLTLLILNSNCYIPDPIPLETFEHVQPLCYPKGVFFKFGVLLPVGVILGINLCLFIVVMISILRGPDGKIRSTDYCLIRAQLKLAIFLFFLLGLTWIFGLLSYTERTIFWSYLFCITATLQGFVLFVYFVICDPGTRELWLSLTNLKNLQPKELSTASFEMDRSNSMTNSSILKLDK